MRRLQIYFDYVDPGSYLVHATVERWLAEAAGEVEVEWIPLELRPPGSSSIDPEGKGWSEMTAAMEAAAAEAGIAFRRPGSVPRTRKAHELSLHAEEKGCRNEVRRAIFDAYFVRGEDIGRVDLLTELAGEAGLDRAEARTVLGLDRFFEDVERRRESAKAAGVRGVPTLEFAGRRIEGFESAEALRRELGRIAPGAE